MTTTCISGKQRQLEARERDGQVQPKTEKTERQATSRQGDVLDCNETTSFSVKECQCTRDKRTIAWRNLAPQVYITWLQSGDRRYADRNKCHSVNYDTRGNVICDDTSQARWDVGQIALSGEARQFKSVDLIGWSAKGSTCGVFPCLGIAEYINTVMVRYKRYIPMCSLRFLPEAQDAINILAISIYQ